MFAYIPEKSIILVCRSSLDSRYLYALFGLFIIIVDDDNHVERILCCLGVFSGCQEFISETFGVLVAFWNHVTWDHRESTSRSSTTPECKERDEGCEYLKFKFVFSFFWSRIKCFLFKVSCTENIPWNLLLFPVGNFSENSGYRFSLV